MRKVLLCYLDLNIELHHKKYFVNNIISYKGKKGKNYYAFRKMAHWLFFIDRTYSMPELQLGLDAVLQREVDALVERALLDVAGAGGQGSRFKRKIADSAVRLSQYPGCASSRTSPDSSTASERSIEAPIWRVNATKSAIVHR